MPDAGRPRVPIGGAAALLLAVALFAALLLLRARSLEVERLTEELRTAQRPPSHPAGAAGAESRPATAEAPVPAAGTPQKPQASGETGRRDAEGRKEIVEMLRTSLDSLKGMTKPPSGDPAVFRARILDLSASPRERVDALGGLRAVAPDARTEDIVREMTKLLDSSDEAPIRADICRYLNGVSSEDLKRSLLTRVRIDDAVKVREKAAESLGPMKQDPAVRQTLEQAALTDPEEKVRQAARRTLDESPK